MGNNGLPDGVDIHDMLYASAPTQFFYMENNNKHHNLQSTRKILTSNKSSVSTLNYNTVTSTNEEG